MLNWCYAVNLWLSDYFTVRRLLSIFILQIYTPSSTLRSIAETRKLKIPLLDKKYSGQRSFSYQGPVTWNNLPFSIRHTQTYSSFKSQLKTQLFSQTFFALIQPHWLTGRKIPIYLLPILHCSPPPPPLTHIHTFLYIFYVYDYYDALCIWFAIVRCVRGPYIAALHVLIGLTVLGCLHVRLRFELDCRVCMFHVLIVLVVLVLNCEILWASLAGLSAIQILRIIIISRTMVIIIIIIIIISRTMVIIIIIIIIIISRTMDIWALACFYFEGRGRGWAWNEIVTLIVKLNTNKKTNRKEAISSFVVKCQYKCVCWASLTAVGMKQACKHQTETTNNHYSWPENERRRNELIRIKPGKKKKKKSPVCLASHAVLTWWSGPEAGNSSVAQLDLFEKHAKDVKAIL